MCFIPKHLDASAKPYQQPLVFNNTPGIPNEKDYEAWVEKEKEKEKQRQKALLAVKPRTGIAPVRNLSQKQIACSCVLYAQSVGLKLSGYGNARNYPVNSKVPAESGFVVTYESGRGHMAHYVKIGLFLRLDESNYDTCRITYGRLLPINSKVIKGYIN